MTDILEEVLNDRNEEKKLYYFKKLLPIIVILSLIVVLIMIINNWHNARKITDNQKVGDILVKAILLSDDFTARQGGARPIDNRRATSNDAGEVISEEYISLPDQDMASKSLKYLIEEGTNKVKELAEIEQINLQIKQNNLAFSEILLEKIINNKNYDEITIAYAHIMWLSLEIDKANLANKKIEQYLAYFDTLSKPFYGTANLIKAHWYIRNGSENLAADTLSTLIALDDIVSSVKEQAKILLSALQQQHK